ncbi:translation initiation factor IF-2 [Cyanobacterium aponinum AL20118]|uniref:Translation initiation factor IF-2 n=1 Tax=Cyanobacterium aponinum AL20115 TaxID=3090662 RepID=A0AAF0ZDZ0_9CHRO|nr:translation initiation factor IF-2 [Cyanobacterium aponinum]WPF90153.1 translation initiation factor IF-2 [Cyanobacterium aponinum AL20115]
MKNGKVRIYDLSKELALDNKDVLEICSQLSIEVKNHSSTITESQAQDIKEAVKKVSMTSAQNQVNKNTPDKSKTSSSSIKKPNKKQEILAVYKNDKQSEQEKNNANSPVLLSPPRPPQPSKDYKKAPNHSEMVQENDNGSPNNVQSMDKSLKQPPARPSLVEKPELKSPFAPELKKPSTINKANSNSKEGDEKKVVSRSEVAVSTSEEEKRAKSKNNNKSKNNSRRTKNNQNLPRRNDKESIGSAKLTTEEKDSLPKPAKPVIKDAKNSADLDKLKLAPKPKLQKPPQRPPAIIDSDLDDDDLETKAKSTDEDDLDSEPMLLEKPKIRKPKQKKSTTENSSWDDDDDDSDKSGKKDAKKVKKRRSLVIDDDDDLEDYFDDDQEDSTVIDLALARPPKPKKEATKATEKTRAPKKQPVKKDKTETKSERKGKQEKQEKPEFIVLKSAPTVRELADLLVTPDTEVIKLLFFKGIAVNITETVDLEIAEMVAKELGVEVITEEEKASAAKTDMLTEADLDKLQKRPPVVTIMGHVDHGKTTLLDSIRNTKVVQGEAGGITQHIGAYHVDVEHEGETQQVVFLDTPGHEAFTAMRARGTKVTDIAVLVVAADDGVRPQTKEAISHARAAKVPIVVAINKIDKPEANPDRVKQELAELELVPEDWGGDTVMVPVSALTGDNLDALLEMIVLVSEVEELLANPDRNAKGTVIEAHLDRARGPVATLLVQNGTLRVGDVIVAGSVMGKIRAMIDDRGAKVEVASPSFAVEILGLSELPEAGDEFEVYSNEKDARAIAESRASAKRDNRLQQAMSSRRVSLSSLSAQAQQGELKELNLIIKADVQGSVEAILGSLKQLPQNEVQIRVLLSGAGEVTETDVDLAAASGAVVIGFNTTLAPGARQAAEQEGVDIREYNVIYKLLDEIEGAMEGLLDPEEVEESLGKAEVRAVFSVGKGAVAGCYVLSGKVVRNRFIRVLRNGTEIYNGNLDSLRRVKDDVKEVASGFECGIAVNKFSQWQEGDIIEAYEMVFKRRTLSA